MVQIGPEEGELSCFCVFECGKIYDNLTNPLQTDVCNSRSLIPAPKIINQHVPFTDPSITAFPTATDTSDSEEIASLSLTPPHAVSPPVMVQPTPSHVPKLSNQY
jgi:hypothetical protein